MAALAAEEPAQIKIRGAFKEAVRAARPVLSANSRPRSPRRRRRRLVRRGVPQRPSSSGDLNSNSLSRESTSSDSALLGASGIKKSSLVKAIKGVASDAQKKALR